MVTNSCRKTTKRQKQKIIFDVFTYVSFIYQLYFQCDIGFEILSPGNCAHSFPGSYFGLNYFQRFHFTVCVVCEMSRHYPSSILYSLTPDIFLMEPKFCHSSPEVSTITNTILQYSYSMSSKVSGKHLTPWSTPETTTKGNYLALTQK